MTAAFFCVRRRDGSEAVCPLTIEQIREEIRLRHLNLDWEAIPTQGRSLRQLKRSQDWLSQWTALRTLLRGEDLEAPERTKEACAAFRCVSCDAHMRIVVRRGIYRCPQCRTTYRVTKVCTSPLTFLLIPAPTKASAASQESRKRGRTCPPKVRAALGALGLEHTATFDQVREAYRELMKSYHPDRVEHLGTELKNLAEKKTKELNGAFRLVQTWYTS